MAERYRWHIFLLIIGVVFLFVLNFTLQVSLQNIIFSDSTTYLAAAVELYHLHAPDSIRPLLIAAINGVPLFFGFGEKAVFSWSIFVNIICWLSVILMLFELLKGFLSDKTAFVFTLCYVSCAGSAILVFHLLAESVFTFFLVLAVFLFKKYSDTQKFIYLSLSLGILILSMMVKPAGKILIILALVWFSGTILKNWRSRASVFIYLSAAILLVQMGMMKKQFGNFTVSYIDSFTYYNYLGTRADCLRTGAPFMQCNNGRYVYFNTLSLDDQKTEALNDIKSQLQDNTVNFIRAYFIDIWSNSTNGCGAIFECRDTKNTAYFEVFQFLFKAMAKVQIIFFSICGIVLGAYWFFSMRRHKIFITGVSILTLYIIAISGISSDQGDRFHVVIYPFAIIMLAKFIKEKTKFLN